MQDKERERAAFDAWTAEHGWRTFTDRSMRRLADAFRRSAGTGRGRILDLACGTGDYTEHLARVADGSTLVATDLSTSCVRACRERVPRARLVAADAERLPFPDGSFSAVFLGNVLHHFPETDRLLHECWRVLERGGRLIAIDPNPRNPIVYVYRVLLGSRTMKTENEVLYPSRAVRAALAGAGFTQVRVEAALPIYFVRDYYARCLGAALSFVVYPFNVFEWLLFRLPWTGRRAGSFLLSRAIKSVELRA